MDDGKRILEFLRTHINYLLPTPKLNLFSLVAVVLRMTVVSLLVYISVMAGVVAILSSIFNFFNDKLTPIYEFVSCLSTTVISIIDVGDSSFNQICASTLDAYVITVSILNLVTVSVLILFFYYILLSSIIYLSKRSNKSRDLREVSILKTLKRIHVGIRIAVFVLPIFVVPIQDIHEYIIGRFSIDIPDFEKFLANLFLLIDIYLWSLFVIGCFIYSIFTVVYQFINKIFKTHEWDNFRYEQRISSQKIFGKLLFWSVVLLLLTLFVIGVGSICKSYPDNKWIFPGLFLTSLVLGSAITVSFARFGKSTDKILNTVVPTVGATIFLSGVAVGVVQFAKILKVLIPNIIQTNGLSYLIPALLIGFAIFIVAGMVNINFLGIHRMYRDRLMELFLPPREYGATSEYGWQPAKDANTTMLHKFVCINRPHLLINTNVVLVDSDNSKYRRRGGDNFIFSSLYCGSKATGWVCSKNYMQRAEKGFTLATAMAISGAVANPNTGDKSFTRNRLVSVVMSILGLRTGYWAPNPNPDISLPFPPNFFIPGITSLFGKLNECKRSIDLTDGGHFENLGLYELIRRKLKYIVVVDATCDPEYKFSDLANAINLVQIDFGTNIRFYNNKSSLKQLRHDTSKIGVFDHQFAEHTFALAEIEYDCGKKGRLFYIKPTLTANLPAEILLYKEQDVKFPHQKTTDQFFDEQQFESYRKLGFHQATDMLTKKIL